jgi:hypothetical protein
MKLNCLVELEVEVEIEIEKDDSASLLEAIKNHDLKFTHKDIELIKTSYWPYGSTQAMRTQKILSTNVKDIRIK